MRLSSILCLLTVLGLPNASWAQAGAPQTPPAQTPTTKPTAPATAEQPAQSAEPAAPASAPASPDSAPPVGADEAAPAPTEAGEAAPELRAPAASGSGEALAPASGPALSNSPNAPNAPNANEAIPSPGELGDRLVGDLPPETEQKSNWTAPVPVLTLHGYLRVRAELMDSFWLGRGPNDVVFATDQRVPAYASSVTKDGLGPDPFSAFRPFERSTANTNCANESTTSDAVGTTCKVDTLQFASMRFRFSPQLNISEDIRIKSTFDVFDNYVLGEGPQSFYGAGSRASDAFPGTNAPSGNLIIPRRAWAEVRNRDLGELRFGLMPEHWGLGMLYNAGNGLDDDYSTDFGRIMGTTKLAGFYLSGAYDFMSEGMLGNRKYSTGEYRPALDGSQLDDLDQFTLSVVRRFPDEDEDAVLARGDVLLNGGAHFQLRHQDSVYNAPASTAPATDVGSLQSLNGSFYTPDVWGQLRYGKLRLEIEAAWVVGKMRNLNNDHHQRVSQMGAALESELRLLNDKLGLYIYGGAATGDSDTEGLSSNANFIDASGGAQAGSPLNNSLISTFRFHPSYRVDMILWRNIMRQVTGAYYMKPGVSYDFLRDNFGQLFGARVDLIYSRASSKLQTWGNDPNLGVELNAQIYWRSDDGPGLNDGYHASLQYGVLFPMRGLGYYYKDSKLDTAQIVRLLLGVVF